MILSLFRKPTKKKSGLKVLSYGLEGTGKTLFALSFPQVALIDAESGSAFYENTEDGKNIVLVANTQNFRDYEEAMEFIADNHEEEGIGTLVTDSLTKIRQNLSDAVLNVDVKRNRSKGMADADLNSNLSIRSWGTIGTISKRHQNQKIDLSNSINIVDIAQEKLKKDDNGNIVDRVPDIDKSSPYDYDIKLRHYTEVDASGNTKFFALVEKDRTKTFKVGEVVENPNFSLWSKVLDERKDAEVVETSYKKDSSKAEELYEKEIEDQTKDFKTRVAELGQALSSELRDEMVAEIKNGKLTNFDSLTKAKQDKLNEILDKYKDLV